MSQAYKIKSDHPTDALSVLLSIVRDYPDRRIGLRNGIIVTRMVTPYKCVAFYVYRMKTMWVVFEDNVMEAKGAAYE